MIFKLFSLLLTLLLVAVPVFAEVDEAQQAIADAKRDAENDVSPLAWGAAGFVCSGFAVLYAYFSTPQVPVHQFIGKSPVYVHIYTTVYKQNAKRRRIQASVVGCAIASAMSSAYWLFVAPDLYTY